MMEREREILMGRERERERESVSERVRREKKVKGGELLERRAAVVVVGGVETFLSYL